ncbi:hypothetical protein BH11PSE11_BH11PSE11_14480 [soil metagenome]
MAISTPRVAIFQATLLACVVSIVVPLAAYGAPKVEPVTPPEIGEIRDAFQSMGIRQGDIQRGEDGRVTLIGEYEDRDEVEAAFAAARAVVGLRRVAPTTPANIKYRLKGFDNAFASTVGKMMQKKTASTSPRPAPVATTAPPPAPEPVKTAERRGPRTHGLIVGVGKYKFLPAENSLDGADKDASDIYKFLVAPDGGAIRADSVRLLTQAQATSVAVKAAMQDIISRTQGGDTVVLFVAAHGLPNAMNKFDIVLHDTEFPVKKVGSKGGSLDLVITNRKTALSDDDLESFVAQLTLQDVRTVIVLDTCYSGKTFVVIPGYLPSRTRSLSQHKKEVEYKTSMPQSAITDLAQKTKDLSTSRIVIVSASENEESIEAPSLGGGAFTQTYITSLRKIPDFADAFDHTKPAVIKIARTVGHSQTPRMLVVPEQANTKM